MSVLNTVNKCIIFVIKSGRFLGGIFQKKVNYLDECYYIFYPWFFGFLILCYEVSIGGVEFVGGFCIPLLFFFLLFVQALFIDVGI